MGPQHHRGDTGGAGAERETRGKRSRPACPADRPCTALVPEGAVGGTGGTRSAIPCAGKKVGDFFMIGIIHSELLSERCLPVVACAR